MLLCCNAEMLVMMLLLLLHVVVVLGFRSVVHVVRYQLLKSKWQIEVENTALLWLLLLSPLCHAIP